MNTVPELEIAGVEAEKGWGMYFDLRVPGTREVLRFSIERAILATLSRGEATFPEIFDRNLGLITLAARLLYAEHRLVVHGDIGGTPVAASDLQAAKSIAGDRT